MYSSAYVHDYIETELTSRGIDTSKVSFSVAKYAPSAFYVKCLNKFTDSIKDVIQDIIHSLD